MGCLASKPKTDEPTTKEDAKGSEEADGNIDGAPAVTEVPKPLSTADNDDVILGLRKNRGSVKQKEKFLTGEASNAVIQKTQVEVDAEILKHANEREMPVADVIRKSRMAEAKAENEKAGEQEALSKTVDRSKDSTMLLRKYSEKVASDQGKSAKVKELESALVNDQIPTVGYTDAEKPQGADKEQKNALISRLEAQAIEDKAYQDAMTTKIGKDGKHTKAAAPKAAISQEQAAGQQSARNNGVSDEEASFSTSIEGRLATAKQQRADDAQAEKDRKDEEAIAATAAKQVADEAAEAQVAAEAAAKAAEEEEQRNIEEAAKEEKLAQARAHQEKMSATQDSATPWLSGSQQ